ncbi:MAG: EAL domain-containing protein [Woronichinia naegeliana WA131]|uniref:EAL domain-containing protein n=1 Tax=Woronichinia naegeliana WA131 TaxID=2824559 RepID=A0A977L3A3_9CYAN|nr:MAG: EAL domain-containing protein [Woronichinia naegeliana WA131]
MAEGVETKEQAMLLQSLGCEEMQGYCFSKPLSAEKMTQFQQFQIQNVVKDTKGSMYLLARVLL